MRRAVFITVCFISFALTFCTMEHRMLYYPVREIKYTPLEAGIRDYRDVYFETADRVKLHGWFIPAPGARFTALVCHGNGGNIGHRGQKLKILRDLGLQVLIFDYRGYGKSGGRPSEAGLYRDAACAYDYLVKQERVSQDAIIAYGESLGGAVVVNLALERHLKALIIEDSFTSAKDMARIMFPHLPSFLIFSRFDSEAKIGKITAPKLLIHSLDDDIVPFSIGRALYAAAAEPKTFLELRGGHNSAFLESERVYRRGISDFLSTL